MMRRAPILALPLVLIAILASSASATTQPSLIVPVKVSLTTHAVTLSKKSVGRGYYVQFNVRNTTAVRRMFTLAGRTIAVPPRKLRLLAMIFDARGTFRYVSRGAGTSVRGTFRVS
jgi:hypothetical protein